MTQKGLPMKLLAVMKDCGYVQKDAANTFHKYRYASAAAVLEKVNDSLVKHGIATLTRSKVINSWERIKEKGGTEYYKEVEVSITLIDTDTGEEKEIAGIGCGMDTGDKAVMKAQTAAIKYAWMMTLQISTGDDPEADEPDEPKEKNVESTAPVYLVQDIIEAQGRAKVTLCEESSGEVFDGVVKEAFNAFKAQKIAKGSKITCSFGEYKSPKGRMFRELINVRRVA